MTLTRRTRGDLDWPGWFPGRRLFDLPERWSDLLEASEVRVEEFEEDDVLVVRAEAPGIDPDRDVEISLANQSLRIKVERRQQTKSDDKKGYRSEFRYGAFMRTVPLPAGATEKDVQATYDNGVLEIRIPLSTAEAEGKKIPITRR